ncbi:MAG: T9SS type A sorting domain-containing protein [Flavobacteriales bacterium]|nr:T9SS type A sorting domain-containing protein [Flavobacteriales bacterium]
MLDLNGKVVAESSMMTLMDSELLVTTNDLPVGIYIVSLTYEDIVITKKIFNL